MKDWENYFDDKNEKPLDRLVDSYSNTSIFRKKWRRRCVHLPSKVITHM